MSATAFPLIHVFDEADWEDAKGHHLFSPTQISTFLECPRKWAWRRIEKIYDPPNASAALGTESHSVLERYMGLGEMPDHVAHPLAAKVAAAGLHLLPPPKTPGILLERNFRFQSPRTQFVYNGLKDLEIEPGVPVPTLELTGEEPGVVDYKTTSNISSYAKTPEDLLFDPQAILYAVDSMARFQAKSVELRWIYLQTKGAHRSHVTRQRIESSHAAEVFSAIEDVAKEAAAALDAGAKPLDLEPNPSACSAYGGCPHRHRCNLKPSDQARSRMSTSLISDLRKRVQGASVASAPAGAGATAIVVTPPAPEAPSVMGCTPEEVPAPTDVPEALTKPFVSPAAAINPPEANLAPPPVQASAPVEEKPKTKRTRKTEAKDPIGADAHAFSDGAPKAEASGHVTITTNVTPEEAANLRAELEQVKEATSAPAQVANVTVVNGVIESIREGFTLYVDCMPIGAPAKLASSFYEKANADVEQLHKVPDYRLVDYGRGAPLFAASVLEQVLESGKDVIVDTRTPEGSIVLESLAARAAFVVRGLR